MLYIPQGEAGKTNSSEVGEQVLKWLREGEMKLPKKRISLKKEQRYQLLKLVFANPAVELEYKQELLEKEKLVDFSDMDVLEEYGCLASLPDQ